MACIKNTLMGAFVLALGAGANAQSSTFDTPVSTGASQAAGVWYTDRYAPAGFTSPVNFMGDNRLKQTIASADGANNRPGAFSSAFYNTQGRKYDVNAGTNSISIDLFVASDWASTGRRMAGLWGTGFDNTNSVSAYPILEFTSNTDADGSGARFRSYDSNLGTWTNLGLPTGFGYDQFQTLNISLVGGNYVYTVGDKTSSYGANGSTGIGNMMLQGYNTATGVDYDIHWDNMNAVPEPASMAAIGMGVLALARRRKNKKA